MASDYELRRTRPVFPADLLDVGFPEDRNMAAAGLRDWWDEGLGTASNYRQAQVLENDAVLGRIGHLVRRTRLGFNWGRNPDFLIPKSLCLNPRLTPKQRIDVLEELVRQLPRHISFYLVFKEDAGWSPDTVAAFTRNGFEHVRGPTYQWKPQDGDVLDWMKSKARSQLKLAQKRLDVAMIFDDAFLDYCRRNLAMEKKRALRPLPLAGKLLDAGSLRGAVRIIAARKPSGSADYDAAIACTWDGDNYYYWMSSHSPNAPGAAGGKPQKDAVKAPDAGGHAARPIPEPDV